MVVVQNLVNLKKLLEVGLQNVINKNKLFLKNCLLFYQFGRLSKGAKLRKLQKLKLHIPKTIKQNKITKVYKNTIYNYTLSCLPLSKYYTPLKVEVIDKRVLAATILHDMLKVMYVWRVIRGYPINGQSTHTNARNARKNKKFFNFRAKQLQRIYGHKPRNSIQQLVLAEYTNRLWKYMWYREWRQGNFFLKSLSNTRRMTTPFDLVNLARGQVNGFRRVGAAALLGKARRIDNRGSIGAPLFFGFNIYFRKLTKEMPYRLVIFNEAVKRKRNKKKKKKNIKKILKKKLLKRLKKKKDD